MNSTQKNPGSQMWRRLNGYLTFEEWHQKPCFICGHVMGKYHTAKDQAHCDGWGVIAPSPQEELDQKIKFAELRGTDSDLPSLCP